MHFSSKYFRAYLVLFTVSLLAASDLMAQDSTAPAAPVVKKKSYTRNTFEGNYIIDNQSVMVPIKGTFEFDINHRFGIMSNNFTDLFGLFALANMRLGFDYTPIKDLQIGFGAGNYNMLVDWNAKYALLKQTRNNSMPVSVTLYGDVAMDTRAKNSSIPIVNTSDRFSYFSQILIARKFTEALSLQAGIALTHFNNIPGFLNANNDIVQELKNDNLTASFSGRYKISPKTSIIFSIDQPLTQNPMNNPHPNISFGLDMRSSGHDFQVFVGNYGYTLPEFNTVYNQNDFTKGQFLIGFNISRLWNF